MEEALDRERRERGAEIARLAKEKKEREEEQRRREKEEIDMKVQMDQLERLKKTAVGAKVFADVTAEVRLVLLPTTPSQHHLVCSTCFSCSKSKSCWLVVQLV